MNENIFDKLDFGPLRTLLDDDDITDISFDNGGQVWIRSLSQGSMRVEVQGLTTEFIEKLAFQCSNVMGTTFNNAKPFLDAESSELRLNFVHSSIATNGIAMVIRKTPAKIRLEKDKLLKEEYFTQDIHDILIKCVEGHCNIIVAGETGSGKTEFVKYLASHTKTEEKIITIEDTLELHLDRIFPQRDIVAMKTNNVASYTDVLVTCMRQNPKWILLSEVRSAEAVSAVRNSISSGHNILSTIHADKASAIPYRLYSLMETDLDVNQFLNTIYRYVQIGVHIRAYYSKKYQKFHREVDEVVEFYVDEDNKPQSKILYQKLFGKEPILRKPSAHLIEYLENQNIDIMSVTSRMREDDEDAADEEVQQEIAQIATQVSQPEAQAITNNTNDVDGGVQQGVAQVATQVSQPEAPAIANNTNPVANVYQQQLSPLNNSAVVQAVPQPVPNNSAINQAPINNNIAIPLNQTANIPQAQIMPNANNIQIQNQIPSNAVIVPSAVENVTPQIPVTNNQAIPTTTAVPLPSLSTQEVPEGTIIQQTPLNTGQTG